MVFETPKSKLVGNNFAVSYNGGDYVVSASRLALLAQTGDAGSGGIIILYEENAVAPISCNNVCLSTA